MKKLIYILILVVGMVLVNKVNAYTEYKIGDMVTYNEIDYYVIKNSSSKEDSVTMLKAEPLSYADVQTYSAGIGAQTYDRNGYGGMQYHESSSAYNGSYVKTTVEAWAQAKAPAALEARLITIDEVSSLGYEWYDNGSAAFWQKTENTPTWLYNSNYYYWTSSPYKDSASYVWGVNFNGSLNNGLVYSNYDFVVRPVITLSKTSLGDEDESIIDEDNNETIIPNSNENKDATIKVNVPNTYMKASIIIIVLGIISAGIGVFIYYKKSNKKK